MKRFLLKTIGFIIPLFLMVIIALLLPTTPRASKSLLMAANAKDSLLIHTPAPRIIFVGGSNLSFGLDSKTIRDALSRNPINTGISASLGLKFMMDNTIQFVQKGDIILLIPEYSHFYQDLNTGSEELLRIVFDVNPTKIHLLNLRQLRNILAFLPKYALSKYNPTEYTNLEESDIYSVHSFNEFGDTYAHWKLPRKDFSPFEAINTPFNGEVVEKIKAFHLALNAKGASLYLSYPGYQTTSFNNSRKQIQQVEQALKKTGIPILGTPERYQMSDSLMFNTPYHLTKKGVDHRTKLFIDDFISEQTKVIDK